MQDIELLQKYGFQSGLNGLWTIEREHLDVEGQSVHDKVSFVQDEDGSWRWTDDQGGKPFAEFVTTDARDVIAFAQSVFASSIHNLSGKPLEEGFGYNGTHYTQPLMFDDYADFVVKNANGKPVIQHPDGEYGAAYRAWRDGFAERIRAGAARAPEAHIEPQTTFAPR